MEKKKQTKRWNNVDQLETHIHWHVNLSNYFENTYKQDNHCEVLEEVMTDDDDKASAKSRWLALLRVSKKRTRHHVDRPHRAFHIRS